jgi:hypothetical protein
MKRGDSHLSDQQLLLDVEGELSARDQKLVLGHLHACWRCRARRQELESAIADFVRVHQSQFEAAFPPSAGPRALLKARITQFCVSAPNRTRFMPRGLALAAAMFILLAFGLYITRLDVRRGGLSRARASVVSVPDSRLTPGATLLVSRSAVCSQSNTKNKAVSAALRRKVFEEYGIEGGDPRAYEVDYLVTPALGGADDIHNLWPHSYTATVWNARVKDALEDRLRGMVCEGDLDLTVAQREIATNWIRAYKKYFHTDQPVGNEWR